VFDPNDCVARNLAKRPSGGATGAEAPVSQKFRQEFRFFSN